MSHTVSRWGMEEVRVLEQELEGVETLSKKVRAAVNGTYEDIFRLFQGRGDDKQENLFFFHCRGVWSTLSLL